ncbi:MAG: epoxyqueuosine reductase QueH [Candidatus Omnitrophica bacterium]|nr:epoxyqueuosine reductase QueH [Candidatus Omnitrophota bacterium]
MVKLLLHVCCSPCSIYPFEELLKNNKNEIKGFYFNPNIHPFEEYQKRRATLEEYSVRSGLEVVYPEYQPDYFFEKISGNEEKPGRCLACWRMRLEETALFARQNGFDSFTTTLLISPYQDHAAIKELGTQVAKQQNLDFYYQDFRLGFRHSQAEARQHGLYRQKYCGCVYSKKER